MDENDRQREPNETKIGGTENDHPITKIGSQMWPELIGYQNFNDNQQLVKPAGGWGRLKIGKVQKW